MNRIDSSSSQEFRSFNIILVLQANSQIKNQKQELQTFWISNLMENGVIFSVSTISQRYSLIDFILL